MSWKSEPSMPPYTCPIIDSIKDGVVLAQKYADDACSLLDEDEVRDLVGTINSQLAGCDDMLEKVRDANSKLRVCAEYWMERADDQEATINALNSQLETVTAELEDAVSEIRELQRVT